ncbi:hypothetical protein DPMN_004379 [Dreissena polymorpha]|uniref:Uncharacterized protein n=1 Tax=Dreissena polymorpha TaxID=45954 RepID=A0A9D4MQQ2_DREPO|nr:hypothetical protein DPMN_004379 [Dreissena polymorpha]
MKQVLNSESMLTRGYLIADNIVRGSVIITGSELKETFPHCLIFQDVRYLAGGECGRVLVHMGHINDHWDS